ncbi:MAG: hypothetical protein KDC79_14470 [Cyclobacteriaceae bacterium]|nr:hypothetical protein [Cyclobacteriaceae bacterium]
MKTQVKDLWFSEKAQVTLRLPAPGMAKLAPVGENSVALFEHLATKYNVPIKVELVPWTP